MVKAIYPLSVEGGISGKNLPPSCGRGMPEGQGGWSKTKESEANLRRSAPPPSRGPEEGGRVCEE